MSIRREIFPKEILYPDYTKVNEDFWWITEKRKLSETSSHKKNEKKYYQMYLNTLTCKMKVMLFLCMKTNERNSFQGSYHKRLPGLMR